MQEAFDTNHVDAPCTEVVSAKTIFLRFLLLVLQSWDLQMHQDLSETVFDTVFLPSMLIDAFDEHTCRAEIFTKLNLHKTGLEVTLLLLKQVLK